jgi:hypothetical protein
VEIRTVPNTNGTPNGMPEPRRWYRYQGTGEDAMPWAITDDDSTDYETGPGIKPGPKAGHMSRHQNRCVKCHRDYRNRKHLEECR